MSDRGKNSFQGFSDGIRGVTIRERFALELAKSLLTVRSVSRESVDDTMRLAISCADSLIRQLDEENR